MADLPTAGLLALLGYDPVKRLLGPTADYLGGELKAFAERRAENFKRILHKATQKMEGQNSLELGVSPRVLFAVANNGSLVDDDLGQHYFAGVLAGSRSKDGKSDDYVTYSSILSRLSTHHMRLHYILYSAFRKKYIGANIALQTEAGRGSARLIISDRVLYPILAWEISEVLNRFQAAVFYLNQEGLIGHFQYGSFYLHAGSNKAGTAFAFYPSVLGCQLFLAAAGKRLPSADMILMPDLVFNDIVPFSGDGIYANTELQKIEPQQLPAGVSLSL